MPIRYPGGTILRNSLNTSSRNSLVVSIASSLQSVGWDITGEQKAYVTFTFNNPPDNWQTCSFDSVTYRFVPTLYQAYDVLRGANAYECALNLMHAILATPSEAGTRFHAATPAHPTLTASIPSGASVRIQWKAAGPGNGFPAINNTWNTHLDSNVGRFGALTLICPQSPHGLRMRLLVQDNGYYVELFPGSQNHMAAHAMLLSPLTAMYIIACRYQFCVYRASGIPQYSSALAGVPFLRARHVGHVISGVAENNGRFEVSTSAPHNYATNQFITITGAEGAPAMNGTWQIEVSGPQSFILLNSSYAPGYVNDSARAAGPTQISDAVWASAVNSSAYPESHLRGRSYVMYNPAYWFSVVNNMVAAFPPSPGYYSACLASIEGFAYDTLLWFDGSVDVLTPRLGWQLTPGGNLRWVGDMWAAFLALNPAPLDAEIQFDGRTWINVSTDDKSSLWLAVS